MSGPDPEPGSPTGQKPVILRRVRYQPKCVLFSTLARLWILPSIGAILVILLAGNPWKSAGSWLDGLARVRFEQWIGLGILAAHFVFMYLASRYRRMEPFREEEVEVETSNSE